MIVICWQTRIFEGEKLSLSLSLSQVARCLTLIEMNMAAARTFYRLVVAHLPPSHVVRFMLAVYTTVRHAVGEVEEVTTRNMRRMLGRGWETVRRFVGGA